MILAVVLAIGIFLYARRKRDEEDTEYDSGEDEDDLDDKSDFRFKEFGREYETEDREVSGKEAVVSK